MGAFFKRDMMTGEVVDSIVVPEGSQQYVDEVEARGHRRLSRRGATSYQALLDPVHDRDVRLDAPADPLADDERCEHAGHDVVAVAGERQAPVHSSQSATEPWITIDSGAAAISSPPTRSWMRSQGSKCEPSARRHSM